MPCDSVKVRAVTVELDSRDLLSEKSAGFLQNALRAKDKRAAVSYNPHSEVINVYVLGARLSIYKDSIVGVEGISEEAMELVKSLQPRWRGRVIQQTISDKLRKKGLVKKEEYLPNGKLKLTL